MPRSGFTHLDLSFSPDVAVVSAVRRFVMDFYRVLGIDEPAIGNLGLATQELTENAIKFSSDGEPRLRIELATFGDHSMLTVRTQNRASPGNLLVLEKVFQDLRTASDPRAHYHAQLRKASSGGNPHCVGLARIRSDAGMMLELTVTGDVVFIEARARLAKAPPP